MSTAYRYYDSPDGQDLLLKTEYVWRRVGFISTTFAVIDVFHVTLPKTYFAMAERFLRVFCPPMAAAACFTTTVYMATKLRKKDDPWNHLLGGVTATCLLNRFAKNGPLIWTAAVPSLILLFAYKDLKLKGYTFQVDETDTIYNIGSDVIEYDVHRKTGIYTDKKGFIRSEIMN